MNPIYEKLQNCYKSLRKKTNFRPKVALILGSGLGDYADEIEIKDIVNYSDIKGFPTSTVSGHKGRFVFGHIRGVPVVIMQGRVHYYEGYPMSDVVLPTRLMGMMGAKALFLTNASGGVNPKFKPGDFMMIEDQIACMVPSALVGANVEELGPRFPDMSEIYSKRFGEEIEKVAKRMGLPLQKGVYLQLTGPNYESPAEVRMCGRLGGDAVGMSTACEAIAAKHMGLEICGISCITNMAAGISATPLNHEEVQQTADRVAPLFKALVTEAVVNIAAVMG